MAHTFPNTLEMRHEDTLVQIDFSVAFDRVNLQGILSLFGHMQYVVVEGCRRKLSNVVSGVVQGSVLGPQLYLLYTAELFSILENKL